MKSTRKFINAAILRNITDLNNALGNETSWSCMRRMLDRFLKIYIELIKASDHPEKYLEICSVPEFRDKVKQIAVVLGKMIRSPSRCRREDERSPPPVKVLKS